MALEWELREAGPADATQTVLLLPGGLCSAGSYAEVMAEPALAHLRLVAATLPGQAGAPPPDDYSVENYARLTAELAKRLGADVVVGFAHPSRQRPGQLARLSAENGRSLDGQAHPRLARAAGRVTRGL